MRKAASSAPYGHGRGEGLAKAARGLKRLYCETLDLGGQSQAVGLRVPNRTCPKCSGEMDAANDVYALPLYVDANRRPAGDRSSISTTAAFAVLVYRCNGCDYVELYQA